MVQSRSFHRDVRTIMCNLLLRDPSTSADDIGKILDRRDLHLSLRAVAHYRSDFRHTLHLLERKGMLVGFRWHKPRSLPSRRRNVRDRRVVETDSEASQDDASKRAVNQIARALSPQRRAIIHAINTANKPISPNAIDDATGMRSNNVRYLLHVMVKCGEVEQVSRGRYRIP
jgi:hypothetical protein